MVPTLVLGRCLVAYIAARIFAYADRDFHHGFGVGREVAYLRGYTLPSTAMLPSVLCVVDEFTATPAGSLSLTTTPGARLLPLLVTSIL